MSKPTTMKDLVLATVAASPVPIGSREIKAIAPKVGSLGTISAHLNALHIEGLVARKPDTLKGRRGYVYTAAKPVEKASVAHEPQAGAPARPVPALALAIADAWQAAVGNDKPTAPAGNDMPTAVVVKIRHLSIDALGHVTLQLGDQPRVMLPYSVTRQLGDFLAGTRPVWDRAHERNQLAGIESRPVHLFLEPTCQFHVTNFGMR